MNQRSSLLAGFFFAAIGVSLGAFGAHGLSDLLEANGRTSTYNVATEYLFYHAFALIVTGLLLRGFDTGLVRWAAVCFSAGIVLFSGSLYILSITNRTALGVITPGGGLFFIAGWVLLFAGIVKRT